MNTVHWVKIAVNTSITLFLLIVLYAIQFNVKPFHSGFYCNDYSVNMKYSASTVENSMLVTVSAVVSFILVAFTEFVNKTHIKLNRYEFKFYTTKLELLNREFL